MSRIQRRTLGWVLCLAVVAVGAPSCRGDQELPVVSLEPPLRVQEPSRPAADGVYRIGAAPIFSPVTGFEQYAPLIEYLSGEMGRSVAFAQRSTYFEINEMVRSGELLAAFVCTGSLLFNGDGLVPLVTPVIDGLPEYRAVCVVSRRSPARSLEDLAGASFAVTDPLSLTGRAYIQARVRQLGADPDRYFQRLVQVEGHDTLLRLVASEAVDGGCVNSLVLSGLGEVDPALAAELTVLEESPAYTAPPVVVSATMDPALKETLRAALLGMSDDPAGRAALEALGIDRFEPASDTLYEATRDQFVIQTVDAP